MHRILKYRYLYTIALIITTFTVSVIENLLIQIISIIGILIFGVLLTTVEYQETQIQPANEQFKTLLNQEIFPRIESEYEAIVDNPADIRINVMFKRRRHLFKISEWSEYYPWEQTLKIESFWGDYESCGEDELCWKLHQGLVGAAMNDAAQEAWSDLNERNNIVRSEWKLTEEQINRTSNLNSILSVPIYLSSDKSKSNPVGVLTLDSTEHQQNTEFDTESVREEAIYWASIIGAIVE